MVLNGQISEIIAQLTTVRGPLNVTTTCRVCLCSMDTHTLCLLNAETQKLLLKMFCIKVIANNPWKICVTCVEAVHKAAEFKEVTQTGHRRISTTTDSNYETYNSFDEDVSDIDASFHDEIVIESETINSGVEKVEPISPVKEMEVTLEPSTKKKRISSKFKCTECNESFKSPGTLKRNTKKQTTKSKTLFDCEICCKTFAQQANLKQHNKVAHDTFEELVYPLRCTMYQVKFEDEEELSKHKCTKAKKAAAPKASKKKRKRS